MVQIVYIATYECFFISHIPNHVPIVAPPPQKKKNLTSSNIKSTCLRPTYIKKKQVRLNAPSLSVGKLQDF